MIKVEMDGTIYEMRGYDEDGKYVKRVQPKKRSERRKYPQFLEFRLSRYDNGKWYDFFRNTLAIQ